MKRFMSALALAGALATPLRAQSRGGTSDGPLIWAKAAGPTTPISIWAEGGTLRIIGWEHDSVVFRGRVPAGAPFFGGNAQNMKLGVFFGNQGTRRDTSDAERVLDLVVYVPKHSQLTVRAVSASIMGTNVSGAFHSVSGSIQLRGVATTLDVESVSGSIDVDATASWTRASTGQGRVLVRGAVQDVNASTIDGAIDVAAPSILRGRFASVNGDIRYAGAPARGALLEFSNHSGTVDFYMPRSVSGTFELSSVTGPIENGFSQVRPAADGPHSLRLSLGRGDAQVTVRTFKGTIRLRPQQ